MKAKKINLSLLGALIIICLIAMTILIFAESPVLYVAEAADNEIIDYDRYTDSDTLLGGTKTIHDYAKTLHHSTSSINNHILTVSADDPIVQIVPKNLFAIKG